MIRLATLADMNAILDLSVACGLFPVDGTGELAGVLTSTLDGELGSDHVWLVDDDGGLAGVAYFAPERMTDGTWNLYMLAVHPDKQRQGRGAALVREVEQDLQQRGARLLLVESSGLGTYDRTRAFYAALGYQEEARIRNFYAAGDDKVIFTNSLAP